MNEQMMLNGITPGPAAEVKTAVRQVTEDVYGAKIVITKNGEPIGERIMKAEIYPSNVAQGLSIVVHGAFCSLSTKTDNLKIWERTEA